MKRLLQYLTLFVIIVGAGALSGVIVMQIATRDSGDIPTPNIVGNEIVTALEKVTDARLHLKITALVFDKSAPRNTVVKQDPKPGFGLKAGRDVRVVISRGSQDVEMVDVRGLSLRQAQNIMEEGEFAIPAITKINSNFDEGTVIAQLPPQGSYVTDLSRVELLVSLGPKKEPFLLPNFTGKELEAVTDWVRSLGLILGRVRYIVSKDGIPGTIIKQDPPVGKPVESGQEVSLVVKKDVPTGASPRTFTIFNYTLMSGLASSKVKIIVENLDGEKEIYSRSHKGGETVSLLVPLSGDTAVRVFVNGELTEVKRF